MLKSRTQDLRLEDLEDCFFCFFFLDCGHAICVERLLRAGADPTQPLYWSIESGYPKCAWRLMEAAADVTQTNSDGQTAKEAAYQYAQDWYRFFLVFSQDFLHLFN